MGKKKEMKNPVRPAYFSTYTRLDIRSAAAIGTMADTSLIKRCSIKSSFGVLDFLDVSRQNKTVKMLFEMVCTTRG